MWLPLSWMNMQYIFFSFYFFHFFIFLLFLRVSFILFHFVIPFYFPLYHFLRDFIFFLTLRSLNCLKKNALSGICPFLSLSLILFHYLIYPHLSFPFFAISVRLHATLSLSIFAFNSFIHFIPLTLYSLNHIWKNINKHLSSTLFHSSFYISSSSFHNFYLFVDNLPLHTIFLFHLTLPSLNSLKESTLTQRTLIHAPTIPMILILKKFRLLFA